MALRFADVGAPEHLAALWFATLLRDGFALTAAGSTESFSRLGRGALRTLLADAALDRNVDEAAEHILGGFASLALHADVPDGVHALRRTGLRLVTLTNGATSVAERLFTEGGIRAEFEQLLSVEDAGTWKPGRAAYAYAVQTCDSQLSDMLLVAVHPWDIDGAARAGMSTAWVNRGGKAYPDYFSAPTYTLSSLLELAARLED